MRLSSTLSIESVNDLPAWQRRGTGIYWERYEKEGFDPVKKKHVIAQRRRTKVEAELPMKDEYRKLIRQLMKKVE